MRNGLLLQHFLDKCLRFTLLLKIGEDLMDDVGYNIPVDILRGLSLFLLNDTIWLELFIGFGVPKYLL